MNKIDTTLIHSFHTDIEIDFANVPQLIEKLSALNVSIGTSPLERLHLCYDTGNWGVHRLGDFYSENHVSFTPNCLELSLSDSRGISASVSTVLHSICPALATFCNAKVDSAIRPWRGHLFMFLNFHFIQLSVC
jgi:hypothetical protein